MINFHISYLLSAMTEFLTFRTLKKLMMPAQMISMKSVMMCLSYQSTSLCMEPSWASLETKLE